MPGVFGREWVWVGATLHAELVRNKVDECLDGFIIDPKIVISRRLPFAVLEQEYRWANRF